VYRNSRSAVVVCALAAVFFAAGCGQKYVKVYDSFEKPISCGTARSDIQWLESQKVSKTTEGVEGMKFALPTTLIAAVISPRRPSPFSVVGLIGALFPVGVGLYIALTAEAVIVAGQRWGAVPITIGAIALFGASAIAASDLYRGASAGLLLAITGVVAHAVGALIQRRTPPVAASIATVAVPSTSVVESAGVVKATLSELTPREHEVLRALTRGARTSEIAAELGIAERTVKAHLASIYLKLGVESRTAAVAVAMQRGVV